MSEFKTITYRYIQYHASTMKDSPMNKFVRRLEEALRRHGEVLWEEMDRLGGLNRLCVRIRGRRWELVYTGIPRWELRNVDAKHYHPGINSLRGVEERMAKKRRERQREVERMRRRWERDTDVDGWGYRHDI